MSVLSLFSIFVASGPSFLISFLFLYLQDSIAGAIGVASGAALQTIAQAILGMVTGLIYYPVHLTCLALMYVDLRVRTEGLDLALQAGGAEEGEPPDAEVILSQAPPPEMEGLITWPEIAYFALFSIVLLAFMTVVYAVVTGVVFSFMGFGNLSGI